LNEQIANILYRKYQDNTLASLYILNYDSQFVDAVIWADQFQKELTPLADHPDILKVHKDAKSLEYKVDSKEIASFLKFINYKPLHLKKKFIFLFDAHDLSVIVSNKLLKVFEEISSEYCLLLFAPDNAQMLPTVTSRAIKLKIEKPFSNEKNEESPNQTFHSPQELTSYLKNASYASCYNDEKKFIEHTLTECLNGINSSAQNSPEVYQKLEGLLKRLKDYETQSAFNNAKLSRLAPFFD
jgi:DNA polymerase-3 subunit delta'